MAETIAVRVLRGRELDVVSSRDVDRTYSDRAGPSEVVMPGKGEELVCTHGRVHLHVGLRVQNRRVNARERCAQRKVRPRTARIEVELRDIAKADPVERD